MAELPNMEIKVIPIKCGWNPRTTAHSPWSSSPTGLQSSISKNRRAGLFFHEEEDTAVYVDAAEKVLRAAMSAETSAKLIAEIIKEY